MTPVTLRRLGNSLGVIVPKPLAELLNAKEGDVLVTNPTAEGVIFQKMKRLTTLVKKRPFSYSGSVSTGVVLAQKGSPRVSAELFDAALRAFAGTEVRAGFSEDDPVPGGFGEWLQKESNGRLSPRHGSFVAAILCSEAGVKNYKDDCGKFWLSFAGR